MFERQIVESELVSYAAPAVQEVGLGYWTSETYISLSPVEVAAFLGSSSSNPTNESCVSDVM